MIHTPTIEEGRLCAQQLVAENPGWSLKEFSYEAGKRNIDLGKQFTTRESKTVLHYMFVPDLYAMKRCMIMIKIALGNDFNTTNKLDSSPGFYVFYTVGLYITDRLIKARLSLLFNIENEELECGICHTQLYDKKQHSVRYTPNQQCTSCSSLVCTRCVTEYARRAVVDGILNCMGSSSSVPLLKFRCINCRQPYNIEMLDEPRQLLNQLAELTSKTQ